MAEVSKQIEDLIAKFDQNLDAYKDVIHEDVVKVSVTKAPAFTILLKQITES